MPAERIRHYLETRQPHLLKAYDATFLVNLIQEKKVAHGRRGSTPWRPCGRGISTGRKRSAVKSAPDRRHRFTNT